MTLLLHLLRVLLVGVLGELFALALRLDRLIKVVTVLALVLELHGLPEARLLPLRLLLPGREVLELRLLWLAVIGPKALHRLLLELVVLLLFSLYILERLRLHFIQVALFLRERQLRGVEGRALFQLVF